MEEKAFLMTEAEYLSEQRDRNKYEKTGYLTYDFKLFHLRDAVEREYTYHYHDFDKVIFFICGRVKYMIEGKTYELNPYDIVFVNRNEIHKPEVDFSFPYERYVLYISPEFLEYYRTEEYGLRSCFEKAKREKSNVVQVPAVRNTKLMQKLRELEEAHDKGEYAAELYERVLFLQFMIELNRACIEDKISYDHSVVYNQKIVDILEYINVHLYEELSIDGIAAAFFLSKYHMMRQFKEETGYTMHQYITEKRILAARDMILNGVPATKAGLECGFKDYSTFLRAFKNRLKKNPSEL